MQIDLNKILSGHVVTVLLIATVLVVALTGALVVIIHPETLSFSAYLDRMQEFAKALGLLAIGRGVLGAGNAVVKASSVGSVSPSDETLDLHDVPGA